VTADGNEILRRVSELPVSLWSYEWDDPTVRHLGPMAQDFAAAFGLGDTDVRINLLDECGVALVAIQALHRRVEALEAELARLRPDTPGEALPMVDRPAASCASSSEPRLCQPDNGRDPTVGRIVQTTNHRHEQRTP